jgi:uncharacterized protein YjbI with pentapeptide repeats
MSNPKHLEIAAKGKDAVRIWRAKNPVEEFNLSFGTLSEVDLSDTDLSKTTLTASILKQVKMVNTNLKKAVFAKTMILKSDLSNSNLLESKFILSSLSDVIFFKSEFSSTNFLISSFFDCNFESSDFSKSEFSGSFLGNCNFKGTNFAKSGLFGTYFAYPDFSQAKLCGAYLGGIIILNGKMEESDFTDVRMKNTVLSDSDLSKCKGLETVNHLGPSTIGFDTLAKTFRGAGCVISPEFKTFVVNAGTPIQLLEELPKILAEVKYSSCFICYGQPDLEFAQILKERLSAKGVAC